MWQRAKYGSPAQTVRAAGRQRKWHEIITHPSANLILGFRRMGKSALGYYLADILGDHYGLEKVSFGVPEEHWQLFPREFFLTSDIDAIPSNSVVVVDELSLLAHARTPKSKSNLRFGEFIDQSGKQDQIVIGISHHSRKTDLNQVMDVDNLIFKKPSRLQIEFDRHEIKKLTGEAYKHLNTRDKEWSYIFSFIKDWKGLMHNPLPSFWSEDVSKIRYRRPED